MKNIANHHPLETTVPKVIESYRQFPQPHVPLRFAEELLMPEEVIARLQRGLELFPEVRRREEALSCAIEERDRHLPRLRALASEATHLARRHFGPGAKETAALTTPRRQRAATRQPRLPPQRVAEVVTTVVEEVIIPGAEKSCAEARCRSRPTGRRPTCKPKRRPAPRCGTGSRSKR